jgi:hypothetical protein
VVATRSIGSDVVRSGDVIAERYRLVDLIGSGGMGIVWLADDLLEDRQVALKRPHGVGVRTDLEREADIAGRVAHPAAVEVFGVVGDGDDCWLAMAYFPSTSLGAKGILPPRTVAAVGSQVAAALAAAHAADVVHRDVTPGNVLVGEDGTAKVTDFGISAWRAATITSSGKISGTAAYVSPEVADGNGAKAPADVFSLGATLFAAVEGTPPYGDGDPDAILARIRAGRREPTARAGDLAPVLDALLQHDRAARPTAAQAKDMLDEVAAGRPAPAWVPSTRTKRRRRPTVIASVVAVAVVAILVLAVTRPWESSADGPARTVLGDPRTADPCAFADADALHDYGDPSVDANYGGFNRCDVLVEMPDGGEVDVGFYLDHGEGTRDQVVRHGPQREDGDCVVVFTLADGASLEIIAKTDDKADLCAMATTAADHAESVLRANNQVPRRPAFDASSLAHTDACALVTAADLAAAPGFANAEPSPGYASWSCSWRDEEGHTTVDVSFDRGNLDSTTSGKHEQAAGHDLYIESDGQTCDADVLFRTYRTPDGDQFAETALVEVDGDEGTDLCGPARTFARSVAARLP